MAERVSGKVQKHAVHLRHLKQQYQNRQVVQAVVELVNANDHDGLAFVARNCGVPPQLRYLVWPILLKYHPVCISPNVGAERVPERAGDAPDAAQIDYDLRKYFHLSAAASVTTAAAGGDDAETDPSATAAIKQLHGAITSFLAKWGRVAPYEPGIAWIAVALAEWFPLHDLDPPHEDGPRVPAAKCHGPRGFTRLFREYPLPARLRSQLPAAQLFTFEQMLERVLLVVLCHVPDTAHARAQTADATYFPVLSGGDAQFRTQLFFKVFQSILPELYQPLAEETPLPPTGASSSRSWLYWWLRCAGARSLHRQDRARIWDLLFGWRPYPAPDTIQFFLNYNTFKFDQLYSPVFHSNGKFLTSLSRNDPFWFPDLDRVPLGSDRLQLDYDVLRELVRRNMNQDGETSVTISKEESHAIPFSLMDMHVQLIFIFIAILQHSEFKLLEFEESEVAEFLNNVPLLSKADDISFKKMQEYNNIGESDIESVTAENQQQQQSHLTIEVGNDGKALPSFDNILVMAGDIWRKWLWRQLEEFSTNDSFDFSDAT